MVAGSEQGLLGTTFEARCRFDRYWPVLYANHCQQRWVTLTVHNLLVLASLSIPGDY